MAKRLGRAAGGPSPRHEKRCYRLPPLAATVLAARQSSSAHRGSCARAAPITPGLFAPQLDYLPVSPALRTARIFRADDDPEPARIDFQFPRLPGVAEHGLLASDHCPVFLELPR